jgi:signal transduction histidine kinase
MRPESARLETVAYHIVERCSGLFAAGTPSLVTEFPSRWPAVDLSPAVRHNLIRIASEALHNAARHAQAGRVVFGLTPDGRRWKLWVSDDGRGMPQSEEGNTGGMGLASMRLRAGHMGASLAWSSGAEGTTVTLLFDPQAESRQPTRPREQNPPARIA